MTEGDLLKSAASLFDLTLTDLKPVPGHEGGRNRIFICRRQTGEKCVLRLSSLGDRTEEDYLAETEFVRYLAENGAPVADVLPSVNGRMVEKIIADGTDRYLSLFAYAEGMLISDNSYRYREGAPLSEYFYNTGKTLGTIHRLSKAYTPVYRRPDHGDKYNMVYLNRLIPDEFGALKDAMEKRLKRFSELPKGAEEYGLVHFDFSDGNYHIDMSNGQITVFDFDNCMNCWYMFDLANLWIHGTGWCQFEEDRSARRQFMTDYFNEIVRGYRTETEITKEQLDRLPLFIDMVLIENIVDEFECCAREGELPDDEDIEEAAECLVHDIPYAGFC